jgi:hypothetical protein
MSKKSALKARNRIKGTRADRKSLDQHILRRREEQIASTIAGKLRPLVVEEVSAELDRRGLVGTKETSHESGKSEDTSTKTKEAEETGREIDESGGEVPE